MNNKKIKIAQVVCRMEFGGAEGTILSYVKHMDNKQFEFHIISQDIVIEECVEEFKKAGFIVHIITHKRKSILRNIIELYHILQKEKFDIIHSHMTLTNCYVLLLALLLGVKVRVSHSHNAFVANNLIKNTLFKTISKINCLVATDFMSCGKESGIFLFGKKNVSNGKVKILNNAISTEDFAYNQKSRLKVRQAYGIYEDDFCIGHIGRFMEQKNHKYLIYIFYEFLKIRKQAKLLLIGTGQLMETTEKLVKILEIEDKVIFVGNTNSANKFYQAMDAFVLPSLFEGLPIVSIEAQAADLRCYFSDRIDKRCKLTENVEFISIDCGPNQWAKRIAESGVYSRDIAITCQISMCGYDIHVEAKRLEQYYIELVYNDLYTSRNNYKIH